MRILALLLAASGLLTGEGRREAAFKNASAALASGDYATAERGFQAILSETPNDVAALGNMGVIYSRTSRPNEAVEAYTKALKSDPGDPALLLNLGLLYFKRDDYQQAKPFFEQASRKAPDNLQVAQLLSACEIYTGGAGHAIPRLERLQHASPVDDEGVLYLLAVAYGKQKQPDKAKQLLSRLLENFSPVKSDFLLGRASYDSALFDDAASAYRRVLSADGRYAGAHRELGKVLVSQGDWDGAAAEMHIALKQDPQDSQAIYFLGAVLAQQGKSKEAIPYLEQTCAAQPDSWGAFYYLGKSKLNEGATAEAVGNLQTAVKLNPDNASAWYSLARALQADGKAAESKNALAKVQLIRSRALQTEVDVVTGGKVIGAR